MVFKVYRFQKRAFLLKSASTQMSHWQNKNKQNGVVKKKVMTIDE